MSRTVIVAYSVKNRLSVLREDFDNRERGNRAYLVLLSIEEPERTRRADIQ